LLQHILGELRFHALLRLDVGDAARGEIRGDPHLAAIGVDLLLDDLFDLSEVGRDVEVQVAGDARDFRLRRRHLEIGVVVLDLLADLGELLVGVLDFLEVILVSLLVHFELLLILHEIGFGLLELQRELAGRVAVARLEVGLHVGLQLVDL